MRGIVFHPTEYIVHVDGLPEEALDTWGVTVQWRGRGLWAVCLRGHSVLGSDGEWDWEPLPSSRTDEWLATHRFPLEEALDLAAKQAPLVRVNGFTPADIIARHADGAPI